MSIHVALRHTTHYRFDRPVALGPHVVRLKPAAHSRTPILSYSLKIKPEKHFINWQQDPFGNYLARLVFPERTTELLIDVEVIADLTVINPFDFFVEDYAHEWPFAYPTALAKELTPYLEKETPGPLLEAYLAAIPRAPQTIVDFLVALNQTLQQTVAYTIRLEPGVQSCEETLQRKLGSCRDTGWLLVQILRHLGLAARFVSGYLVQLTADEKSLDGPSGTASTTSPTCTPGPRSSSPAPAGSASTRPPACSPARATSRSPARRIPRRRRRSTASPTSARSTFDFSNTVTRFKEDPRVTKPYSEEQWAHIRALGRLVDEKLTGDGRAPDAGRRADLRLDRRHGRRRNGTPPRSANTSASSPRCWRGG